MTASGDAPPQGPRVAIVHPWLPDTSTGPVPREGAGSVYDLYIQVRADGVAMADDRYRARLVYRDGREVPLSRRIVAEVFRGPGGERLRHPSGTANRTLVLLGQGILVHSGDDGDRRIMVVDWEGQTHEITEITADSVDACDDALGNHFILGHREGQVTLYRLEDWRATSIEQFAQVVTPTLTCLRTGGVVVVDHERDTLVHFDGEAVRRHPLSQSVEPARWQRHADRWLVGVNDDVLLIELAEVARYGRATGTAAPEPPAGR